MKMLVHILYFTLPLFILGCAASKTPSRVVIEKPKLTAASCEEANRLVNKSIQTMGYTLTSYTLAAPGRAGRFEATKEKAMGGIVTVSCSESGANINAQNAGALSGLLGAGERPHHFVNSFPVTFHMLKQREAYEAKNPEAGTLQFSIVPLDNFASQNVLGSDIQSSGVLPVRITITNNTPRPYAIEVSKIFLVPEGGGRVGRCPHPAGAAACKISLSSPGKAYRAFCIIRLAITLRPGLL